MLVLTIKRPFWRPRTLLRRLIALAAAALAAVLALAACGSTSQVSAPMPADQRAEVAAYFTANPSTSAMVPQGWFRGVLTTSQVYSEPCLGGTCKTWSGTAIEPDGTVAALQSVQGESAVSTIVSIGDDFIWTKDPHPSYSEEVKVLKYGAVPATPAPSPASPPASISPSPKRTS